METRTEKHDENLKNTAKRSASAGKRKKVTLVIWIGVIILFAVASLILLKNPALFDKEAGEQKVTGSNGFYDFFYEADYTLALEDYEAYPEYLELDRYLYYKNGNETVGVIDKTRDSFGKEVLFFEKYFEAIINGDCEEYNSLFTEKYFATHEKMGEFTPQMVYGMEIEEVYENETNGVLTFGFDVNYKIFRNNGTFRDDIYSDATRTQYIEVTDSEGDFKISALKFYVYANE